jgi:two-component system cell cycle response regulator DivK
MPHLFDGENFSRVLEAAERLATDASDNERRLTELVRRMEVEARSRVNGKPATDWLDAVRHVCVAAGEQRHAAESIVEGLAFDVARNGKAERPRVLIVDDSEDNRDMAAVVLEAFGFRTASAANGLEGLIVAHYSNPAVVLLDIAMPILGGIEAARLLKASSVTRQIPIIAYTATPLSADGWLARLFAEVLRKPVSPDAIVAAVRQATLADGSRSGAS